MFSLDKHDAKITNVNYRKQFHGEVEVAHCDISLRLQASALVLDGIDPKLRPAFFEQPGKGAQQALPIDGNNLTALTLPYLKKQKIGREYEGYELWLHSLLGHIDPLFFADANLKVEDTVFIEGGSVDLFLKVAVKVEEKEDAPLLAAWRRGEVRVSLVPPAKQAEQEDLGADGEGMPAAA